MKSTGMVRKVDQLGRVVIPIELRRNLGVDEGDSIEIFIEGDTVILQKYKPNREKDSVLEDLADMLVGLDDVAKKDVLERAIKLIR